MFELIRHIESLLVTNDCVVIPGLGAVLAHTLPARYDSDCSCFIAPSRTFSFNASLSHNDGLLIGSVARSKSISFEAAGDFVAGEVKSMRRALSTDGRLSLGLVGSLIMTSDLTLSFMPGSSSELSPSCFWLQSVHVTPISDVAKRREQLLQFRADAIHGRRLRVYVYRAARVAASLALLLTLAFVLTTPIHIDKAQYASLGIENFKFDNARQSSASKSLLRVPGSTPSPISLYLRTHDDASEQVDTAARASYFREHHDVALVNSLTPRFEDSDDFCLIVASLISKSEADKFIANSKYPHQLGILAKDGRYRVYAATGPTKEEARKAAQQIVDHYSVVWVCRR